MEQCQRSIRLVTGTDLFVVSLGEYAVLLGKGRGMCKLSIMQRVKHNREEYHEKATDRAHEIGTEGRIVGYAGTRLTAHSERCYSSRALVSNQVVAAPSRISRLKNIVL